mmetsp:Transcript_74419/g.66955  ORF Transcript_74419/g.66955 Transcript_74419/m.66955 type:complete len:315 (-) Transcript_74419:184-1128(-)
MSANMIHQIWMEGEAHLKEKQPNLYHNVLKMKSIHGADNYRLWSEDMIKQLIQTEYSELLETFCNYPHFIMQLHLAKYIILHHFGGFYVDIDCECKQSLYQLIKEEKDSPRSQLPLVVKDVDEYRCNVKSNKKFINNHFIYIPYPDHALMNIVLDEAPKTAKRKTLEPHLKWVMRSVGPYFLTKCIKKYKIQTQKELKKASHKDLIHDVVSQHQSQYQIKERRRRSSSRLSYSSLSESLSASFSKSELKGKVHTSDVVNMIPAQSLDYFLNHKEHNIWLNEKWVRELKMVNRAKLTSAQVAVVAVCIGVLVIAL